MKIALIYGGNTSEGVVSKMSKNGIFNALKELNYNVIEIEFDNNIVENIKKSQANIVFNGMYGQYGEDGFLSGILDLLKIPYTHNGRLASGLSMNKEYCNKIFTSAGIPVNKNIVLTKNDLISGQWKNIVKSQKMFDNVELFIKPTACGSSIDCMPINLEFDFSQYQFKTHCNRFFIEKKIIGKEITACYFDNKVIGAVEIVPKNKFYDFESKYSQGGSQHIKPTISEESLNKIYNYTQIAHNEIGLRTISRSDFIIDNNDNIYLMDVNSNPGMTPQSLVPDIAKQIGMTFNDIIKTLIDNAMFD